jgi:Leucine-rich repeat (LRR) protein
MSVRRPSAAEVLATNVREQDPTLSLAKCQLTTVPLDVLRLPHALQTIDLSANKLRRLCFSSSEDEMLLASSAAAAASMDGPEAKETTDDDELRMRKVVGGVRELNLSLNKLQTKDPEAISHLRFWTGLERLDLSGNGIQHLYVDRTLRTPPPQISADHHFALIAGVETHMPPSPSLHACALSNATRPPDFWGLVPSGLVELKLSFNCLSELPAPLKEEHDAQAVVPSSLSKLHVDCNGLKSLPATLALHCPNLTQLYCGDNALKVIPASFTAFHNLSHLDLSGNCISALPTGCDFYANLASSLVHLSVKDNALCTLPPTLSLLTSLQLLDLRKNRIDSIPCDTLDLPTLRVLDLSCNKLKHIDLSRTTLMISLSLSHTLLT